MAVRTQRPWPIAEWRDAYLAGKSGEEIARADGRTSSVTVLKMLRKAGVSMRGPGRQPGKGESIRYPEAQRMLDNGESVSAVARWFGVTPTGVRVAIMRGRLRRPGPEQQCIVRQRAEFIRVSRCRGCGCDVVGVDRCEACR